MTHPWQVSTRLPHSHCHYCGAAYPPGARWPKVCVDCGETTWRNPLPVGVLLVPVSYTDGDGLVVVRRDIEPARGELCLPGGFLEYGETWPEGAVRELREEAGLHADPAEVELFHVASTGVHVLVFGIVPARDIDDMPASAPTEESTEWIVIRSATELAFPSHTEAAARFFARS